MKVLLLGLVAAALVATQRSATTQPPANSGRVTLGGVTVLAFRATCGGFAPAQRKAEMQTRIVEILSHGDLTPDDVRVVPGKGGHSAAVMVGQLLLVTATEADARANGSPVEKLAATWAENFRRGFAAAKPRPTRGG